MKRAVLLPESWQGKDDCASEFISYWEKVTGEKLPIVYSPEQNDTLIVFGTDIQNPFVHKMILTGALADQPLRQGCDDYRLTSFSFENKNGLLITAGNTRSYFYAVYDFFERSGVCRYFWDGDRIIRKKSLSLDGFDVYEKPGYQYRGIRYFAHRGLTRFQAEHWSFEDWKKEFDWVLKKRLNLASIRTGVEDLFQRTFKDIVPYPKFNVKPLDWQKNSHLDRTPFWKLEYRGELLKKVYAYGNSRGLIQPTDCGTMTHWYSMTPPEFLEKVDPGFIPEQVRYKGRPEGRVWDVDKPQNMENYWKLSETQLEQYGSSPVFHTIGLAERRCFPDHRTNHSFKKYVFRKIEEQVHKHYPQAPLMVSSWDFIATWSPQEVQDFIAELNPENTLLLDYTSDIYREHNNFLSWNVVGKFPWIYGIFHAYESSNELRGNYDNIQRRYPAAENDPQCKGMVFWPENSHGDTLMLEYFSYLAWNRKYLKVEEFIPKFCAGRYAQNMAKQMQDIWLKALPLIKESLWGEAGPLTGEPIREVYPGMYFQLLNRGSYCWSLGELDEERQEFHRHTVKMLSPLLAGGAEILESLAELKTTDEFLFRDCLDIARTIAFRFLDYALSAFALAIETWQLTPDAENENRLKKIIDDTTKLSQLFSSILASAEEFSLYHSLENLKKTAEVNPIFEDTLKRTAVSHYCRSFIYEPAKYCYEAEWQHIAHLAQKCIAEGNTRPWRGMLTDLENADAAIIEAYAERTLADMRPDTLQAKKDLPGVLKQTAAIARSINEKEVPYVIF